MLDGSDYVEDIFGDRSGGSSTQESTVYVQREAPTLDELRTLGAARFQSVALESTVRPQKRSLERYMDYPRSSFHASPQAHQERHKRQRVDANLGHASTSVGHASTSIGHARYDPDEPIISSEGPTEMNGNHGQTASIQARSSTSVNVQDSQSSPKRNRKLSLPYELYLANL